MTRDQRWMNARNVGTKEIPPYAILMLANKDGGIATDWPHGEDDQLTDLNFFANEAPKNSGSVRWLVSRPEGQLAAFAYQACMYVVNGPTAIPVGGVGQVTQDWPAQVLHFGKHNVAPNGVSVGPRTGSFGVWSGEGGPFIVMSHDSSWPIKDKGHNHTVWIAPKSPTTNRIVWGDQRIGYTDPVGFSIGDAVPLQDSAYTQQIQKVLSGDAADTINYDGLYLITFSATIYSSDAPTGVKLGFALQTKLTSESNWTTRAIASRYQGVELNGDGVETFTSRENVAATIVVALNQGDKIQFSSISTYRTFIEDTHFAIVRLGNAARGIIDELPNDDPDLQQFPTTEGGGPDPCMTIERTIQSVNPQPIATPALLPECTYDSVSDGLGGWTWELNPLSTPCPGGGACSFPSETATGPGQVAYGACAVPEGDGGGL